MQRLRRPRGWCRRWCGSRCGLFSHHPFHSARILRPLSLLLLHSLIHLFAASLPPLRNLKSTTNSLLSPPLFTPPTPTQPQPPQPKHQTIHPQGSQVAQKEAVLLALCARSFSAGRTIVFTRTKQRAHRLKILFGLCKLPAAGGWGLGWGVLGVGVGCFVGVGVCWGGSVVCTGAAGVVVVLGMEGGVVGKGLRLQSTHQNDTQDTHRHEHNTKHQKQHQQPVDKSAGALSRQRGSPPPIRARSAPG